MDDREWLTIYGDYNCPFSALASARADRLLAAGTHNIRWRAVQHNPSLPARGRALSHGAKEELLAEVRMIADLSVTDVHLHLVTPDAMSNTAVACAALAAERDDAHWYRRRTFAAVWVEGLNISQPSALQRLGLSGSDPERAARWQRTFEALPRPITPSMILPNGVVSRGLGALGRLEDLVRSVQVIRPVERRCG